MTHSGGQSGGFRFGQQLAGGTSPLVGMHWHQDGAALFAASDDLTISRWNRHSGTVEQRFQFTDLLGHLACFVIAPQGEEIILATSGENPIHMYHPRNGTRITSLYGHNAPIANLCITPDGSKLISASQDSTLKVWGLANSLGQITLQGHKARVNAVVAFGSGMVASGSDDGTLRVWNLDDGDVVYVQREHQGSVTALAASPDGHFIASASDDRTIHIRVAKTGRLICTLEGHTETITGLKFAQAGTLLASHAKDGKMFLWRTDSWERVASLDVPARRANTSHLMAFHPQMPLMAVPASDGVSVDLWELDHRGLIYPVQDGDSIQYTTARVALVGDSGVGKTALGLRMVHGHFADTNPTHGQEFWTLNSLSKTDENGSEREVVLWDFAGQSDYRLIHTLFMDDIDVALILFDGSEFDEPMRGVEYWLRQLENAGRPVKKILVGGRLDRGEPLLTEKDLEAFCRYHGIQGGYVGTSALTGRGIPELLERIQYQIEWDQMPPTVTSTTFRRIKSFLLELKADPLWNRVLITPAELRKLLHALDTAWTFSDGELMTAVRHLENHGYVALLDGDDLEPTILLYPELLIQLASSFVMQARQHPRGLGALEEDSLIRGTIDLPELAGLIESEQNTLREAATLLLLKNHLCFREQSEDRVLFIFPALINRKHPHLKHVNVRDDVAYRVSGAISNIYASLVVQLSYTTRFTSAHRWQNQAQFQMGVGEICGFRLEEVEDGEVDLVLYYGADVQDYTRTIFQKLFEKFLTASGAPFTCYQPVICPGCRHRQDRSVVVRRIQSQSNYLHCVECGCFIDLISPPDRASVEAENKGEMQQEHQLSQMRTAFELALVRLKGMVQDRKPSCFISYAWGKDAHRQWVRRLVHYLEQAGIEVIWDQSHEPEFGHTLSRFIEQIEKVNTIIAVGTPLYREKYECETGSIVAAEAELINLRLMGSEVEKQSVLPILLEGDSKSALPPLMQARVFADFREERFYFLSMFKLIYTMYGFSPVHPVIDKLQSFMHRSAEKTT